MRKLNISTTHVKVSNVDQKNALSGKDPISEGCAGALNAYKSSVRDELHKRLHYYLAEIGLVKINFQKAREYGPIKEKLFDVGIAMNEGETFGDRARDDSYKQYYFLRGANEMKTEITKAVDDMRRKGMARKLVDAGVLVFSKNFNWNEKIIRMEAIKILLVLLGKNTREEACTITKKDFNDSGLGGLLFGYYKNSPYRALKEIYPDLKKEEMSNTPVGFYEDKQNRINAIKNLLNKLGKNTREEACTITKKDFNNNGLRGLFEGYYKGSPYRALKEIYPDLKKEEMSNTPVGFYEDKQNRINVIKNLLNKLGKNTREEACTITYKDFHDNGLIGLFKNYYKGSPYLALKEIYPDLKKEEMSNIPKSFYEDKQNRINVIKNLLNKLGKNTREEACTITSNDFNNNGLGGLLGWYYKGSPYLALKEIYPDLKKEEMKYRPRLT